VPFSFQIFRFTTRMQCRIMNRLAGFSAIAAVS
jgi:hypothetical protein